MSNRKAESRKPSTRKVRAADGERQRKSARPNFRLVAGAAFIGAVASLLVLLFLLEGPEVARRGGNPGGVTVIEKAQTALPKADVPETKPAPVLVQEPDTAEAQQPGPQLPPVPQMQQLAHVPETIPSVMAETAPQPAIPLPSQKRPVSEPKPDLATAPMPLPRPQPRPQSANAPVLPWQQESNAAVNTNDTRLANLPPTTAGRVRTSLPSRSELRSWVKSNAREFVGGVDADGMPLYRFDLWLDAPEDLRSQMRTVSYAYLAPSAQPPEQSSSDAKSGFRVKFGAASCAEKATVTLTLVDGRERTVTVDGCRILN